MSQLENSNCQPVYLDDAGSADDEVGDGHHLELPLTAQLQTLGLLRNITPVRLQLDKGEVFIVTHR